MDAKMGSAFLPDPHGYKTADGRNLGDQLDDQARHDASWASPVLNIAHGLVGHLALMMAQTRAVLRDLSDDDYELLVWRERLLAGSDHPQAGNTAWHLSVLDAIRTRDDL